MARSRRRSGIRFPKGVDASSDKVLGFAADQRLIVNIEWIVGAIRNEDH